MSRRFYISIAILLLITLGGAGFITHLLTSNGVKPEERRAAGIVAGMCGAGALVFLYTLWDNRGARVALHERGLATQLRGRKNRFLWSDIETMRAKITVKNVHGIKAATIREYYLVLTDGTKIAIPSGLQEISQVGETIEAEVYPLIFQKASAALDRGEQVEFGDWTLSPKAVTAGKTELPWSEISAINLQRGVVAIMKKDGSCWQRKEYGDLPNAPVFLQLGERFLRGES